MNHNDTRGTVTEVIEIKRDVLTSNTSRKNAEGTFTSGGIFSDFELAWLYSGAYLKVVSVSDGTVQSSWDFSSITRDSKTEITCVIEYEIIDRGNRMHCRESQLCLIVSYSSNKDSNKASYISFCHPRTSKILHTITTKEKVTCMSVITSKKDHSCPISGIIKLMSGALAIGTKSGNLLIMDIKEIFTCTRKPHITDVLQNRFSCMMTLNIKQFSETEIKDKICKVDDENYHVTVSLPVTERKDARDCDLFISSMMYIPEGLTLAVGFRSGLFQLWDVCSLKKLFKSSSLSVPTPVVRFGFQEPCNDPQNFCYLWVLHESGGEDDNCLPFAVMYGILYKKVTSTPEYGRYYKNFVHCKKRFDMDVDMDRSVNGRCITSSVVSNTPSNMLRHITTNEMKKQRNGCISEADPSKINLFVMVFETWENTTDINSHISLVVFDMNQWYKAQMPHQCYHGYSVPFVNFILLDRVSERKSSILDTRIRKDTIQQFLTFNLSEEYSYPSSLSFDTIFLTNTKLINLRIPGVQRCIIEQIIAEGPNCLVNPSKYFTECKDAGLRPCFSDSYGHIVLSQIQQRNYILTILLEHKMSSFLVQCVKEWANGSRAVSGCTLPNFIQWAWDCVTRIKLLTDTICVPLFDYSGDDLDRENYQKLKHCSQLLKLIRDLLIYILKNFKCYLLDSKKLNYQVETLQLVTKYFDVIIWSLDVGLLPEKVTSTSDRCIPTYMISLMQYAEQRREELKKVVMKDKYFLKENSSLYIIDSILEKEPGGKALREQWERESCGMTNGFYPPVTLQSLLRMFLMPHLSNDTKHFIMMYFLLDVCDYHRDDDMKEQLLSFAIIFFTDSKFLSLVRFCWFIDHEKFEEASDTLAIEAVIGFLNKNQNLSETILKSCVCQQQYALALKCERVVKVSSDLNNNSFHTTLLLLNGLVMEAYSDLRRRGFVDKKLLQSFFKVCDDLGYLKEVFKFPMLHEEEQEFLWYLDNSSNKDAGDLKIMYLLSRGRYVEAVDVNHHLNSKAPKYSLIGNDTTKQDNDGRTTTRDLLVNAFSKTLPSVTNELLIFCRKEKDKLYRHKHIEKPTPMSVVVHVDTDKQVPVYKSSFESVMQAAICKTAETWNNFPKIGRHNKDVSFVQNTPFLRSEMMTPKRKHCGNISFSNLNKTKSESEQKNPDEPPVKRVRKNLDVSPNVTVTNDESLLSAPLEVTTILRTPHIQKRLNKLLQNTPETSPLTSILKSSEMSRFKQPQKVGFSVPERHTKTPQRKTVDVGTMISTPITESQSNLENSTAKKSLVKDFERSQEGQKGKVEVGTKIITPPKGNTSAVESPQCESKDDSYYSLESVEDDENMMSFILDTSKVEEKVDTNTTRTFIECMSEESSANATPIRSPPALLKISSNLGSPQPQPPPVMEIEPMEIETRTYDSLKPVEGENTEFGDKNDFTGIITSVYSNYEEGFYPDDDNACLQVYATDSKCVEAEQDNVLVEKPNEDAGSNLDKTSEYDSEEDKNQSSSEQDDISDEEDEYREEEVETERCQDEEAEEEECANERRSSVTEITDSSAEDSDVEIIEDTTPTMAQITPLYRNEESSHHEAQLDKEEELSEKTYESDYTYSDESVGEQSEPEPEPEERPVAEEENMYVEDSNDVEYDDEDENEYEDNSDEENDPNVVIEQDSSAINYDELKNIVMTITAAENKASEAATEVVDAEAMSSHIETTGVETDVNTIYESILLDDSIMNESVIAKSSQSVCEIYDTSMSVVETTVNLSAVDANEHAKNSSAEIISQTIDSDCSLVNTTQADSKNDGKTENTSNNTVTEPSLVFYFGENSVTSIGEDMLTEERNTSEVSSKNIAVEENKEVVGEKHSDVKNTTEASSSSEDQQMEVDDNKRGDYACAGEAKQFCMVEKNTDEAYSSVKEHGFLRTSVPECNIHIIEKVRNEMYSSDDGYDDSDVLVEQISDENQEANATYCVEKVDIIDRVDERNREAAVNVVIVENITSKFETPKEAANSTNEGIVASRNSGVSDQTSVTVIEAGKSQHMSSLISENDVSFDISVVRTLPNSKENSSPEAKKMSDENNLVELACDVDVINKFPETSASLQEAHTAPPKLLGYDSPVVAIKRSDSSTQLHDKPEPVESKAADDEVIECIAVQTKPITNLVACSDIPSDNLEQHEDAEAIPNQSTPRRSIRLAKRRSLDCIPTADLDDSLSVKSGSSVAGSVSSRVSIASGSSVQSSKSQRKKSFSRLELRKSTQKPPFKQLEVIVSDEETSLPKNTEARKFPMYAVSEPGKTRNLVTKRKRSVRSDIEVSDDDDRLSSISETGDAKTVHKRNVRRKSNLLQMNEEKLDVTPESATNKRLGKFVSSTPLVLNKAKCKPTQEAAAEIEQYASSRRLTRSQKMYMEYGFMNRGEPNNPQNRNLPSTSGVHRTSNVEKLDKIDEDECEYSLSVDEVPDKLNSPSKPTSENRTDPQTIKPISSRLRSPKKDKPSLPSRFSKRLSGRFEMQANEDSLSSEEPPSPAKSISSVAESTSSRASTASKRSTRGRRSYTSMELRKSSVRPNFKPLAVIPSDDESQSFQPPTPTKNTLDDSFQSSTGSSYSRASIDSRRSRRNAPQSGEEISDVESSVSNLSNVTASSVGSRKRTVTVKRILKKKKVADEDSSSEPPSTVTTYANNRRLTRNQKIKMEKTLKGTSRKKEK